MSQEIQILEYLKQGHSLSPIEALDKFGCFRLGARVWDLRAQGHNIQDVGDKKYSVYKLFVYDQVHFIKGQAQMDLGI